MVVLLYRSVLLPSYPFCPHRQISPFPHFTKTAGVPLSMKKILLWALALAGALAAFTPTLKPVSAENPTSPPLQSDSRTFFGNLPRMSSYEPRT